MRSHLVHDSATTLSSVPAVRRPRSKGRPVVATLALALLVLVQVVPAWANSVAGSTPDDLALATRVQAALLADTAFQAHNVDLVVRAEQGRLNLSGWLSFTENDPRARMIAAGVPGVNGVTSNFRSWSTGSDPRLLAR